MCPPAGEQSLTLAGSAPQDYLRYPSPLRADPAGQFLAFEQGQGLTPGPLHSWLANPVVLAPWYTAQVYFFYGGIVDSSQLPGGVDNRSAATGLISLQYWFFYPYGYFPTTVDARLMGDAPLAGNLLSTDLHEGDWQHVTVLLNARTLLPEWLYMARHADEGQIIPWSSPTLNFDDGHPIVQAAFGDHATYDNNCGQRPRTRLNGLISDWVVCGSGRFAFRAESTPLVDLARTTIGCWRGHFGEAEPGREVPHPSEGVALHHRLFVFVAGPVSPLWQQENRSLAGKGACADGGPIATEVLGESVIKRMTVATHSSAGPITKR
jgi:hypothetical protein